MAEQPTKAERVMMLRQAYPDWSVKEIAVAIYGAAPTTINCAYVRVALNQRKGTSYSESDRKYRKTEAYRNGCKRKRARCQLKELAYEKSLRQTGDKETAKIAGRKAAADARARGAGRSEIEVDRKRAMSRVIRATADRKAAKAAYAAAPYVEITPMCVSDENEPPAKEMTQ